MKELPEERTPKEHLEDDEVLRLFKNMDTSYYTEYQRLSNNIIMTCLNMKSPNQVIEMYRGIM